MKVTKQQQLLTAYLRIFFSTTYEAILRLSDFWLVSVHSSNRRAYLELLDLAIPPPSSEIDTATEIALRQLEDVYIFVGMMQAVLLRCTGTDDIRILRGLVLCITALRMLYICTVYDYFWEYEPLDGVYLGKCRFCLFRDSLEDRVFQDCWLRLA